MAKALLIKRYTESHTAKPMVTDQFSSQTAMYILQFQICVSLYQRILKATLDY